VVNCGQTGALWLLIVNMAMPEEGGFVVSLIVSHILEHIERRGYCAVALALICRSPLKVVLGTREKRAISQFQLNSRLAHRYLSEASSDEG
jgi:hypothetical protein